MDRQSRRQSSSSSDRGSSPEKSWIFEDPDFSDREDKEAETISKRTKRKNLTARNMIHYSDDDEDELPQSKDTNTLDTGADSSLEGRVSPFIVKAIRRSLHRIAHESEDEETDDVSDSEEPPDIDEETGDSDDAADSDVQFMSADEEAENSTSNVKSQKDRLPKSSHGAEDIRKKIRRSIRAVGDETSDDESSHEHSSRSIDASGRDDEQHIVDSDPSELEEDTSRNTSANKSRSFHEQHVVINDSSDSEEDTSRNTSANKSRNSKEQHVVVNDSSHYEEDTARNTSANKSRNSKEQHVVINDSSDSEEDVSRNTSANKSRSFEEQRVNSNSKEKRAVERAPLHWNQNRSVAAPSSVYLDDYSSEPEENTSRNTSGNKSKSFENHHAIINESSELEEDTSRNTSGTKSKSFKNHRVIINESSDLEEDTSRNASANISKSLRDQQVIVSDSSEHEEESAIDISGNTLSSSFALTMAKEETASTTLDPMAAQKRTLLVCKQQQLEAQLAKSKKLYTVGAINALPDGGEKLRLSIASIEKELRAVMEELRATRLLEEGFVASGGIKETKSPSLFKQGSLEIDPAYLKPTNDHQTRELGKKAQDTLYREQSLTMERLQDLHGSLVARPAENERAKDPRGLRISLMPHQQHALAWLLWREKQKPRGGVLADDMGLGKTLTMIALVMASNAKSADGEESDDEDDWKSSARNQRHLGGTLVVAPASLVAQWAAEVTNRCKHGTLTVELYHGTNRETVPKRLARNDIVITTYNIVSRAYKEMNILYKIRWRRVILDEAHVIRNHKSRTCESVCGLEANTRWALTGTPIQNKEMDLYSILKFLKCSPFDDIRVWKRWVDNKNAAGHERLATVMKTLMLRRTKQELQAKGTLASLPDKTIEVIDVELDPEERLVYDKVMVYSRTLFGQFLAQRAEKAHMFQLGSGKFDKPSWTVTHKDTQFTKAQNQLLSMHADVKSHQILVLLLRLRQVCCHPSLIYAMLDEEETEQVGVGIGADVDLMSQMNGMNIKDEDEQMEGEVGVDERVAEHLLTSENPVFDAKRRSSKMRAVLEKVEEILSAGDKLIIVSQWTSVFDILQGELTSVKGASVRMFTGKVAVKDRQGILDDFNSPHNKSNVLLLSLTAGGVGLNLVGANHLLLIDIHWNPQLESQAQDRIYRFGQKKNVHVYKYICVDTIEERIKALQEKKLELATAVLSGGGKVVGSKLSLDDMKSLFGL